MPDAELLARTRERVQRIADGGHINTTYKLPPIEALAAFRRDLRRILDAM